MRRLNGTCEMLTVPHAKFRELFEMDMGGKAWSLPVHGEENGGKNHIWQLRRLASL